MTSEPPVTLDWLTYHWGDAYLICYARDRWAALRRDTHRFLTADTLAGLTRAIEADYAASPVPRDFDPPADPGPPDDAPDDDDAPQQEAPDVLVLLRDIFPQWAISYSPHTGTWTARDGSVTIRDNSPALLCCALLVIERRQRQAQHGPDWPPRPGASPT